MSKPLYIDADEEIISVIGRVRSAPDSEVPLVAPKRAVILQSLINLRLLAREAKREGKRVILVTQDEAARSLADKAGLETTSIHDGSLFSLEEDISDEGLAGGNSREERRFSSDLPDAERIGSSSFFDSGQAARETTPLSPSSQNRRESTFSDISEGRRLPVRDRTPRRLTALNSTMVSDDGMIDRTSVAPPRGGALSQTVPGASPLRSESASSLRTGIPIGRSNPSGSISGEGLSRNKSSSEKDFSSQRSGTNTETPLARFFDRSGEASFHSMKGVESQQPLRSKMVSSNQASSVAQSSGRRSRLVRSIIVAALLMVLGTSVYAGVIFLPRADVMVSLKPRSESAEVTVFARSDATIADTATKTIPLRLIEEETDVSDIFQSTGTSSIADRRSRGTIVITNSLDADQPLVATTRFESSEGKIFRIVKGVVVPRKGSIETEVIADKSGSEYDIAPTTFTVPGLSGGPKFEAIKATSAKVFSGGGGSDETIASVSADDVADAKGNFENRLDEAVRKNLEERLGEGEHIPSGAISFQVLSSGAFPGAGAVAPNFEYRFRIAVRALVVRESDIRTIAVHSLGEGIIPSEATITLGETHPDFAGKTLEVSTKVFRSKESGMDTDAFVSAILGKEVEDVRAILSEYPDIQKIEVMFRPEFLVKKIPSRASQVSVRIETVHD